MALTLNTGELEPLRDLMDVLLSPTSKWPAGWPATVLARTVSLFQADKGIFTLPVEGRLEFQAANVARWLAAEYAPSVDRVGRPWSLWRRIAEVGPCNRQLLWGARLTDLYRTVYWNEVVIPNRAFDMVGVGMCVEGTPDVSTVSQLLVHHDSPTTPSFGDHGLGLMHLIMPAYRAGVLAYRAHAGAHGRLATMLDRMPVALVAFDRSGRLLHANTRYTELAREIGADLDDDIAAVVQRVVLSGNGMQRGGHLSYVRHGRCRLRILCTATQPEELTRERGVLVTIERLSPPPIDVALLREHFGLTPAESRVAQLLVEKGLGNSDLARELGLSPHTVRHHVEQVLLKLGVGSRTEAVSVLRSL